MITNADSCRHVHFAAMESYHVAGHPHDSSYPDGPLHMALAIPKDRKYSWYASRYLCGVVASAVLGVFVCRMLRRALRRLDKYLSHSHPYQRLRNLVSPIWHLVVVTRDQVVMVTLPPWLYGAETLGDAMVSTSYCGAMLFYAVNRTTLLGGSGNLANQMGIIAFSQLPMIVLLVSKNNPVSALTGIAYQKLNYLHRAASRACLLCSWIHAALWTPRVLAKHQFGEGFVISGIVALLAFTLLWTSSFRVVRRVAWRFFMICHIILTITFLVAAVFHWQRLKGWVLVSFMFESFSPRTALAFWGMDRTTRAVCLARINADLVAARVQSLDDQTMEIVLERPGLTWAAGQHALLSFPTLGPRPHNQHPFSFASAHTRMPNEARFLVRVHSGTTRRLRDAVGDLSLHLPVLIEGPYGVPPALQDHDTIVLLAGGSGITLCLSLLLQLVHRPSPTDHTARTIRLVWHIRHTANADWVLPQLEEALRRLSALPRPSFLIQIDIHRTRADADCIRRFMPFQQRGHRSRKETFITNQTQESITWHHSRAFIPDLLASLGPEAKDIGVVVCGPISLVRSSREAFRVMRSRLPVPMTFYEESLAG